MKEERKRIQQENVEKKEKQKETEKKQQEKVFTLLKELTWDSIIILDERYNVLATGVALL